MCQRYEVFDFDPEKLGVWQLEEFLALGFGDWVIWKICAGYLFMIVWISMNLVWHALFFHKTLKVWLFGYARVVVVEYQMVRDTAHKFEYCLARVARDWNGRGH